MAINPHVFRGYDIRGLIDADLTEDTYYSFGRAYGTFLSRRRIKLSPVGHDNRRKSVEFKNAFIKGLNESGIDTIDLGYSQSQIVYFSNYHFKTKGSAIITASHNPPEYNGLKLSTSYSETTISKEIEEIKAICDKGQFINGSGKNQTYDIFPDYKAYILSLLQLKKTFRLIVDTCNSASGIFYPTLLREAGCEVIEQNTNLDSNFPLGAPDPTDAAVLKRLSTAVTKNQADIGLAYDADGDRMAVCDEKGNILWMDNIVSLFAIDILDFLPGSPIVYNTLCSRQVTETITSHGGKPVIWLTGHSFIKEKIKNEHAPFGGELSGHIFFTDNFFGHDDAAYATLRLLSFLERKQQSLSQVTSTLSQYKSSPEIKLGLADDIKFQFVTNTLRQELINNFPGGEIIDIDGIRIDHPDEMVIIRASQNGPYITVKFEAKTTTRYLEIQKILSSILHSHPEIDFNKGTNIDIFT